MSVRSWTIPLTFAGLGGLGAMLLSGRGRKRMRFAEERLRASPGRLAAWDDCAQTELDDIQRAVKELTRAVGTHKTGR